MINKSFRKHCMQKEFELQSNSVGTQNILNEHDRNEVANVLMDLTRTTNATSTVQNQRKGGSPKDTTTKKKQFLNFATTSFFNEVAIKHAAERKSGCRMKKGRFGEIVEEIRCIHKIEKSVVTNRKTIDKRVSRGNLVLSTINGGK